MLGTYFFIFFAVAFLLLVVGWPLWLLIWAFRQKKKTGKFPWKKFILIFILLFLLGGGIKNIALTIQRWIDQNYGIQSIGGEQNENGNWEIK